MILIISLEIIIFIALIYLAFFDRGMEEEERMLGIYWDGYVHRRIDNNQLAGYAAYEQLIISGNNK